MIDIKRIETIIKELLKKYHAESANITSINLFQRESTGI